MIDVNMTIYGIVLYCDESVLGLNLGNGYVLKKIYLKDIPFWDRIKTLRGDLTIGYLGSVKEDLDGEYFICLYKNEICKFEFGSSENINGTICVNGRLQRNPVVEAKIKPYRDIEKDYIHKVFSLLRLFKVGNIGLKETFIHFDGITWDTLDNVGRNIVDQRLFSLSDAEITACNSFLADYSGKEYELMKGNINRYIWGLEQIDDSTGFELLTSTLEMTLLADSEDRKIKDNLSKRTAVLLKNTQLEQKQLYDKMRLFYKYRSESLHCGKDDHISKTVLFELQEITRLILVESLKIYKCEVTSNAAITSEEAKTAFTNQLKSKVQIAENNGTFLTSRTNP